MEGTSRWVGWIDFLGGWIFSQLGGWSFCLGGGWWFGLVIGWMNIG